MKQAASERGMQRQGALEWERAMVGFLRLLAFWGVADAVWLALRPAAWARFWGAWVRTARRGGAFPRVLALLELAASLLMLRAVRRP